MHKLLSKIKLKSYFAKLFLFIHIIIDLSDEIMHHKLNRPRVNSVNVTHEREIDR